MDTNHTNQVQVHNDRPSGEHAVPTREEKAETAAQSSKLNDEGKKQESVGDYWKPEPLPNKKPPLLIQGFLWIYGFMWLNTLFMTGLNSLYLGYIDYDMGSMFVSLSIGLWLIFKFLPRFMK